MKWKSDGEDDFLRVKNTLPYVGVCAAVNDEKRNPWPTSLYDANLMKQKSSSIKKEDLGRERATSDGPKHQLMHQTL